MKTVSPSVIVFLLSAGLAVTEMAAQGLDRAARPATGAADAIPAVAPSVVPEPNAEGVAPRRAPPVDGARSDAQATGDFVLGEVSAMLAATETTAAVLEASATQRQPALREVRTRFNAGIRAFAQVKRKSARLEGDARELFDSAYTEARDLEKAVKKSFNAARKADANTWTEARTVLAADYEAYATAVGRAEVFAAQSAAPAPAESLTATGAADAGAPAGPSNQPES